MKKILSVLLVTSDLFGMDSTVFMTEEPHLTPSVLASADNPQPEQVKQMFIEWKQIRQRTWDAASKWVEEKKIDPRSEASKQAESKWIALNQMTMEYLFEEGAVISREPNEKERYAATKLFSLLLPKSFQPIDEVRVVDAESYINGLYLNRKRKDYFLSLLDESEESKKSFALSFQEFIDKAVSPDDPFLKQMISKIVLKESENSKIYRNLMVSYLAETEAIQSMHLMMYDECRDHKIFRGEESEASNSGISLNIEENAAHFTYFPCFHTLGQRPNGIYCTKRRMDSTIFHEFGHCIDRLDDTDKKYRRLEPKFTRVWEDSNFLKEIDKFKKDIENRFKLKNLEDLKREWEVDFKTIEDFSQYMLEMFYGLSEQRSASVRQFDTSAEMWQIVGVRLQESLDKRVLYINRMSDFALSVDRKMPFRIDHSGTFREGFEREQELIAGRSVFRNMLPTEVYGTMMEFLGTSLDAYVTNLQYPYGLGSLLMNEYRLNSRLPYFGIVHEKTPRG